MHLRDSSYRGAQRLGHGEGYVYPHDAPEGWVPQQHLPAELVGERFYRPGRHGAEPGYDEQLERRRRELASGAGVAQPEATRNRMTTMDTSDVIAVIVATLVAILAGAMVVALGFLVQTLRTLRATVDSLRKETIALLDDAHDAVRQATNEVDRIDRLVGSAERINDAVDGAQRMAYKTLASPVVKAMAFGTGVSRAAHRLREGEPPGADPGPQLEAAPPEAGVVDVQAAVLARRRVRARARLVLGAHAQAPPHGRPLRADRSGGPLERHDAGGGRRRPGRHAVPRGRAQREHGARGRAVA